MCCSYASYLQLFTLPFRISERQSQRSYILTCLRYTTRVREEMKMVALQSCCAETRRFLLTPFEVSSWRNCGEYRETTKACTVTSKAECGRCKPGAYAEGMLGLCKPCSPCCYDVINVLHLLDRK